MPDFKKLAQKRLDEMNVTEPITVPRPEPRTDLQSAMLAITTESGKVGYLYPAPKRALAKYIRELEATNTEQAATILDLADRLSEFEDAEPPQWEGCP